MLGYEAIAALIPHQGAMCLLERVLEWDAERVVLSTTTHQSPDNPLRSRGRLRALHLCEYASQAMAVHGGLVAQASGALAPRALLAALRDVHLYCEFIEELPGALEVMAQRLVGGSSGWQYAFRVCHEERILAEGKATIALRI